MCYSFPLRSDLSSASNCDGSGADAIRLQIQTQVTTLINDQIKPRLNGILSQKYRGLNRRYPAQNCMQIHDSNSDVESGMYWLRNTAGNVFTAYCDFDLVCNSFNRTGWMRIANFDLTDVTQTTCPNSNNFRLIEGNERYCERMTAGYGCNEHTYSVSSIPYTRVCGRATGLQIGGTDGFLEETPNRPVSDVYVDGISLTYNGNNVLWTFAASYTDDVTTCPCSTNSVNSPPPYVMNNYFCEAGAPTHRDPPSDNTVYYNDKLWDGQLCRDDEAPCCSGSFNPPWFFRDIGPQTSDIRMRLCSDQGGDNEEVGLTQLYLYIQ